MSSVESSSPLRPLALASAFCDVARVLSAAGHPAWLVGEALHRLLRGEVVDDVEFGTSAPVEAILELFPTAVPTRPADGAFTLPTKAGPAELMLFRNGSDAGEDLRRRDFTLLALAYDPIEGTLLDPFAGRNDLAAGRLRCVGRAAARLAEDPTRCLRAVRLCADYGYAPDAELEAALAAASFDVDRLPRLQLRRELGQILLSARVKAAISRLRGSGLERRLVPAARPDSGALMASLPATLPLRLAAWLRDSPPRASLRRLGFGRSLSEDVALLLEHHPVDHAANPAREASLRRLRRRLGESNLADLCLLRDREISLSGTEPTEARASLNALRAGLERLRAADLRLEKRTQLAIDGRQVMAVLGCGPGRRVGEALRRLANQIDSGALENTPEALRDELRHWSAEDPE